MLGSLDSRRACWPALHTTCNTYNSMCSYSWISDLCLQYAQTSTQMVINTSCLLEWVHIPKFWVWFPGLSWSELAERAVGKTAKRFDTCGYAADGMCIWMPAVNRSLPLQPHTWAIKTVKPRPLSKCSANTNTLQSTRRWKDGGERRAPGSVRYFISTLFYCSGPVWRQRPTITWTAPLLEV